MSPRMSIDRFAAIWNMISAVDAFGRRKAELNAPFNNTPRAFDWRFEAA